MNVKELIDMLRQIPQDMNIYSSNEDGICLSINNVTVEDDVYLN